LKTESVYWNLRSTEALEQANCNLL